MASIRVVSDLSTILQAVQNKLINDSVFGETTCLISLAPTVLQTPPSDQYVMITPGRQTVDQPIVVGAGNHGMFFSGEFQLTLWSRLALDEDQQDVLYLTDGALGSLATMNAIMKSLQLFDPQDQAGNWICAEPMRLVDISTPQRATAPGWGQTASRWNITYTQVLA